MPPDLPNEQEIILKKRARRRLVGAIALVLLMVIVLPSILQDRAEQTNNQESIKVTMPESANQIAPPSTSVSGVADNRPVTDVVNQAPSLIGNASEAFVTEGDTVNSKTELAKNAVTELTQQVVKPTSVENANSAAEDQVKKNVLDANNASDSNLPGLAANEVKITENKVVEPPVNKSKSSETKQSESKPKESKPTQAKVADSKPKADSTFSVQVGVFSDDAKVKQLQSKLKEIGYNSHTEKLTTPKGEKIRLRAGTFSSRQNAVVAQVNIKKIGLDSMVVSND